MRGLTEGYRQCVNILFSAVWRLIVVLALASTAGCFIFGVQVQVDNPAREKQEPESILPTGPARQEVVVTLLPENTPTPSAAAREGGSAPAGDAIPFNECSLVPGWVGCDPSVPGFPGRLALADRVAGRLIVLDTQAGDGWQAAGHPNHLAWSPQGDRLMAGHFSEGGLQYAFYTQDGQVLERVDSDAPMRWQPDNQPGSQNEVHSAGGDVARLVYTPDMRWTLRIQPVAGEERIVPVEPQPTDKLYALVGWVPGTDLLLAHGYYASNAAMLYGGQLLTIDTVSGEKRELDALAPLGETQEFAWNPAQGAQQLAFLSSAAGEGPAVLRLALFDFATGQLRYPLPDGLQISGLAWHPDGTRLAFAAVPLEWLAPPEAAEVFRLPAVYALDPGSGEVQALTQPPQGAVDAWPQWADGGEILLFARASGQNTGEVRVRRIADGSEWVLVEGISLPDSADREVRWVEILAFAWR